MNVSVTSGRVQIVDPDAKRQKVSSAQFLILCLLVCNLPSPPAVMELKVLTLFLKTNAACDDEC
jgi:hypothetical protein